MSSIRARPGPHGLVATALHLDRGRDRHRCHSHRRSEPAATRMARDPALTLVEVQTILRHAHLSTTALYTALRLDDLLDQLAEHYQRPAEPARWSATYDADDIAAVFGDR